MPIRRLTFTRPLVAIAMVAASSLCAIAQQSPSPSRVRGTIESVDGDVLAVKSRSGEDVKLHMTPDMRVVGITKISLSDIKVGSFIGTTTVPGPDGMPTAVEVHVFPEEMRGTGDVYLINHNTDSALMTLRYHFPEASFDAAEEPFEAGGHKFNRGSFVVRNIPNAALSAALTELGVQAYAVAVAPTVKTHPLRAARIAIMHTWLNTPE